MPARADVTSTPRYHAIGMADLPADDDWLTPPEAERLQRFTYTKRREEARLGRWTAKQTLAGVLGLAPEPETLRDLVVRNAADGAPEVFIGDRPAPLSISMTDRADWAVCTVIEDDTAIGCDLELIEHRSTAFVRDWFTSRERTFVDSQPADEHDLLANLIWSAKESALKVLRTGLRRDTRSVEISFDAFDPAGANGTRWNPLTTTTAEGDRFEGWWTQFGEFLLTYVSADPTDPPATLLAESPLERAQPSHAWMSNPITSV